MSALRVAVCGVGWFGGVHARCWTRIPGVELVGLADPAFGGEEERGGGQAAAQEAFHHTVGAGDPASALAGVPRFTSVEALLAEARPDLVDVSTSEEAHVAVALSCLAAGADVVVEKPAALDPVDVAKLALAADEHGRLVFPAHILRFDARYAAVRERLRASGDTPPRFISTQRHFQGQAHAVYGRVHPALNALIHDIDVAIWLVGEPPDRVSGYERTGEGPRAPRLVSAVLEWRDGPSALLENAWNLVDGMAAGYEFRCTVMHDEFTAIVAPAADVAVFERAGTATFADVHLWPELPYGVAGALRAELMHFALCARDHRPSPIVGLADAERAITVAAAVVRSASGEGWVDVPGA